MMSWLVTPITPLWTWTDLRASHRMYLLTTPWSRGRTGHKLEIRWQSHNVASTVLGLMPGSLCPSCNSSSLLSVFSFTPGPRYCNNFARESPGTDWPRGQFTWFLYYNSPCPRLDNVNKTHLGSSLNFERANEQTKYISIIIWILC